MHKSQWHGISLDPRRGINESLEVLKISTHENHADMVIARNKFELCMELVDVKSS